MLNHSNLPPIQLNEDNALKKGVAYRVVDEETGKELVAKMISEYLDEDNAILISEFRKLTLLSAEPEFASVYFLADAILEGENRKCYVMEFVLGYDLDDLINDSPFINYEVIINIIKQIASGLEKAHHCDIFHNDLHNGNIRINTLEYVKIIDFLWRNVSTDKSESVKNDVNNFIRIVNELTNKCNNAQLSRIALINRFCKNIISMNGVSKKIDLIDSTSFDLSLLKKNTLDILSALLKITKSSEPNLLLSGSIEAITEDLPVQFDSPIIDDENYYLEENRKYYDTHKNSGNPIKLPYLDSRVERIQDRVRNHFFKKLYPLKSIGLLSWNVYIENKGELFVGPYNIKCVFILKLKYIQLNELNKKLDLLESTNNEIEDILLAGYDEQLG